MKFLMIFTFAATVLIQDSTVVGQWRWTSYKIHGRDAVPKSVMILVLGEDGSYEERCNSNTPELQTCQTGTWATTKSSIQFNQAKLSNGTIPRPRIETILRLTSDSLVLKGKEGTDDIICTYIKVR